MGPEGEGEAALFFSDTGLGRQHQMLPLQGVLVLWVCLCVVFTLGF